MTTEDNGVQRSFDTGATRDTAGNKIDMEGFTNPRVMQLFAKYMNMNRLQSDGQLRASDNWQKGIPEAVYMKSLRRHHDDVWMEHRYPGTTESGAQAALCGLIFNAMGLLHEILKLKTGQDFDGKEPTPEMAKRILNTCQEPTHINVAESPMELPPHKLMPVVWNTDVSCHNNCMFIQVAEVQYPCNHCIRNPFVVHDVSHVTSDHFHAKDS